MCRCGEISLELVVIETSIVALRSREDEACPFNGDWTRLKHCQGLLSLLFQEICAQTPVASCRRDTT